MGIVVVRSENDSARRSTMIGDFTSSGEKREISPSAERGRSYHPPHLRKCGQGWSMARAGGVEGIKSLLQSLSMGNPQGEYIYTNIFN